MNYGWTTTPEDDSQKLGPAHPAGAPRMKPAEPMPTTEPKRFERRRKAEEKLVAGVFDRCHAVIREACAWSSVPPEFLGALTANESGGDPKAARFEPAVYRHLKAVASGASPRYGGIRAEDLSAEIEEMLHPKSSEYHGRYLTPPFGANHQRALAALEEEALRELATSWGYTQIMGYHMVARGGTVRELLDPAFHFRMALDLLAEFAEGYQLDLGHEFEEMFRCWNTGQPYGKTYDPHYVERALQRMDIYREMAPAFPPRPTGARKDATRS